jgi:hypothetical protein
MAIHKQWRDSYNAAFRVRDGSPSRVLLADTAISQCVGRLVKTSPRRLYECEEIQVALEDLRISQSFLPEVRSNGLKR